MYWDFVPSNIFQASLESRVYFILCSWIRYSVTSQGLQRMRRTTQFQSTCPCRPLSFGAERSEGIWFILKQCETNNIINKSYTFFLQTTHADLRSSMFCGFRPGIQDIAPNKVCVWMTMTTLEAASCPACPGGFFYGFCLARCASSIWRAPIGASGQSWCHSIGGCFRWGYDGYIKSVFSYRLFSTFKRSSVTTSVQLQLVNETFPWVCRFKIFEPGAIWHKSFGDKSILSSRLRYCHPRHHKNRAMNSIL